MRRGGSAHRDIRGSAPMNIHNSRYHEVHARSLADPEGFWAEAAREIRVRVRVP